MRFVQELSPGFYYMLNLCVGFSLITYWLIGYFPVRAEISGIMAFYCVDLALLAGALLIWGGLFTLLGLWRIKGNWKNAWLILSAANFLSIFHLSLHAYNSSMPSAVTSLEGIMHPSLADRLEFYLKVASPFLHTTIVVCLIAVLSSIVGSRKYCKDQASQ